jgi:vancomycin resistance protein YoaR
MVTTTAPLPAERPKGASVWAWMVRLFLLSITAVVLLFFLLMLYVAARQVQYRGHIFPGISAYGVNLSSMSKDEAVKALSDRFTYGSSAIFTFRDGGKVWQRSATDLGVKFDPQKVVDTAYNWGRDDSMLVNVWHQAQALLVGYTVESDVVYDQSAASGFLNSISGEINRPTKEASVVINGTNVSTAAGQIGRTLDVPATLGNLRTVVLNLNTGSEIPLIIKETKPTIMDADTVGNQVRAALSGSIQLYIEGQLPSSPATAVPTAVATAAAPDSSADANTPPVGPWTIKVDFIAGLINVVRVDDGNGTAHYEIKLNTDPLKNYLTTLAPQLAVDPVNARFSFNESSNQLTVLNDSVDGRQLNVDSTLSAVKTTMFQRDNRNVALKFAPLPAKVNSKSTAKDLGIVEETVEATTFFLGSTSERRVNISVAASKFQGIVIEPGQEFSFNQYLGDVSPEQGYQSGLVIVGNRTIPGVGGGVCQVSSTVFQAAFFGGFPIKERYPHGYRVGYYESSAAIANGQRYTGAVGLDATVYNPVVDLKFVNDTPYYILIESIFRDADRALTIKFFSTNTGRTVTKEGPVLSNPVPHGPTKYTESADLVGGQSRQVDYAVDGVDVHVYRTIKQDGKVIVDHEDFFSHYLPWSAVFEVAPGMAPKGN